MTRIGVAAAVLAVVVVGGVACGEGGGGDGGQGGFPAGGSGGSGGSGGAGGTGGSAGEAGSGGGGEAGSGGGGEAGSGGGGEAGSGGSGEGGSGGSGEGGSGGGSAPVLHRVALLDVGGISQLTIRVSADVERVEARFRTAGGDPVPADLDLDGMLDGPVSTVPLDFLPVGIDGVRTGGVATSDVTGKGGVEAIVVAAGAGGVRSDEVTVHLAPIPRPAKGEPCDPTLNFDMCQDGLVCRESQGAFACDDF